AVPAVSTLAILVVGFGRWIVSRPLPSVCRRTRFSTIPPRGKTNGTEETRRWKTVRKPLERCKISSSLPSRASPSFYRPPRTERRALGFLSAARQACDLFSKGLFVQRYGEKPGVS
ncbi:unnamed protein product, partial [Hapterophycus canaliculatus]